MRAILFVVNSVIIKYSILRDSNYIEHVYNGLYII